MNALNMIVDEKRSILGNDYLISIIIFIIAFIPRFMDLGNTIIADEQLWILRSKEFAKALMSTDMAGTHISNHPGVITMWLGAISIGMANFAFGHKEFADLLFAAQLPFSLVTSVAVASFYNLSKIAFNSHIAIISSIILAFDIFYLAYSRIIHLDAVLSSFMICSFLALLVFYQRPKIRKWLMLSSFLGGLSVLAKVSGVYMFPMAALVAIVYFIIELKTTRRPIRPLITEHLTNFAIWVLIALITIYALWPAMWNNPQKVLGLFLRGPGMVAHEQGQFFLGAPVDDPGALFYPLIISFRSTPLSLVFFIVGVVYLVIHSVTKKWQSKHLVSNTWLCLSFIFFFLVMMTIPDKKAGRYILPVFPAIALLSGIGIYNTVISIEKLFTTRTQRKNTIGFVLVFVGIAQLYCIISVYPYFLSYYNPLAGGPKAAVKAILVGRGEGVDLVAGYLNQQANAENIIAASEFEYLLNVHFKGEVMKTTTSSYLPGTLEKSDYLVIYISGLQKREFRLAPEVLKYHENHQPEITITLNSINYAYVYDLRKTRQQ
jgi:4-amino-4-deoxy-L-arabinose transferase-like glycosyltransferase